MVETAFVTHFPIPPIYPYLPFTPGYLTLLFTYMHLHAYLTCRKHLCNMMFLPKILNMISLRVRLGCNQMMHIVYVQYIQHVSSTHVLYAMYRVITFF